MPRRFWLVAALSLLIAAPSAPQAEQPAATAQSQSQAPSEGRKQSQSQTQSSRSQRQTQQSQTQSQTRSGAKLKGLLITGGCCHDYGTQKHIITQGVSQRASIDWDVVHEGGTAKDYQVSVYKQKGWAKNYDVIVHNECFGDTKDDEFVKSIAQAHYEGVPAVFIHCALHSYRAAPTGAEAWRELIGVTSRRHERHRPVLVRNLNSEHPVMAGFPSEWKTPNGELYMIEKIWPNCTPLAEAFGEDTQKNHTVMWVNTFGKARVFGTSLGHHNETMNNDVWLGVVSRGLLWACGKLTDDGRPAPGYEGAGIGPIEIPKLEPTPDTQLQRKKKN